MDNKKQTSKVVSLDDIVFEHRNKEYGAYVLRGKYRKYLIIAFLISLFFVSSGVAVPFIKAYMNKDKSVILVKETVAEMSNVKQEEDIPPPPPPPPPEAMEQQVRYTAPVVVDSVKEDVQ